MNTDNMLLSGETIDYGPCAFMDDYDSAKVFSSIDHGGRYAYRNQPAIAQWNLACLGQCLLPFIDDDEEKATKAAQAVLNAFPENYTDAWLERLRDKFGLAEAQDGDDALMQDFLDLLEEGRHDFTLAFRRLAELAGDEDQINGLFDFPDSFGEWLERWRQRCALEATADADRATRMLTANPVFIPRNHLVERAIDEAYAGDFGFFHRLYERWRQPCVYDPDDELLATPPRPDEVVQQTFCGT